MGYFNEALERAQDQDALDRYYDCMEARDLDEAADALVGLAGLESRPYHAVALRKAANNLRHHMRY